MSIHHGAYVGWNAREMVVVAYDCENESRHLEDDKEGEEGGCLALEDKEERVR